MRFDGRGLRDSIHDWFEYMKAVRDLYDTEKVILLRPRGTLSAIETSKKEMEECLKEIEMLVAVGDVASPLQRIAIEMVLQI